MYKTQCEEHKGANYSEEYEKEVTDLVKGIAKGDVAGYFVIVNATEDENENTTVCKGFSSKKNCSKGIILETALANLGIPDEEIIQYLLLKRMRD